MARIKLPYPGHPDYPDYPVKRPAGHGDFYPQEGLLPPGFCWSPGRGKGCCGNQGGQLCGSRRRGSARQLSGHFGRCHRRRVGWNPRGRRCRGGTGQLSRLRGGRHGRGRSRLRGGRMVGVEVGAVVGVAKIQPIATGSGPKV